MAGGGYGSTCFKDVIRHLKKARNNVPELRGLSSYVMRNLALMVMYKMDQNGEQIDQTGVADKIIRVCLFCFSKIL